MTHGAAVVATFDVPAQYRRAAGDNRPPRLLLGDGRRMGRKKGLAVCAQDVDQAYAMGHGAQRRGGSSNSSGEGVPVSLWCARWK